MLFVRDNYRRTTGFLSTEEREKFMNSRDKRFWRFCELFPDDRWEARPYFEAELYDDGEYSGEMSKHLAFNTRAAISAKFPGCRVVVLDGSGPVFGDRNTKYSYHFIVHSDPISLRAMKRICTQLNAEDDAPMLLDESVYKPNQV